MEETQNQKVEGAHSFLAQGNECLGANSWANSFALPALLGLTESSFDSSFQIACSSWQSLATKFLARLPCLDNALHTSHPPAVCTLMSSSCCKAYMLMFNFIFCLNLLVAPSVPSPMTSGRRFEPELKINNTEGRSQERKRHIVVHTQHRRAPTGHGPHTHWLRECEIIRARGTCTCKSFYNLSLYGFKVSTSEIIA